MTDEAANPDKLTRLTVGVIAAYVSNNVVPRDELPGLIDSIRRSLAAIGSPPEPAIAPQTPAVPIRKSVQDDYIVCLEDGKKFKSLKRHLMTHYNMTPDEYRQKWGLSADYPMVAPGYAAARSALAKLMGLGRKKVEPVAPKKARGKAAKTPATRK